MVQKPQLCGTMHHSRAFLVPVFALLVAACAAPEPKAPRISHKPSEVVGVSAKCEKICDVQARAETLHALCDSIVSATKDKFSAPASCKPDQPIGFMSDGDTAVIDAAMLEVVVKKPAEKRYAVLAIRTDKGWELARELAVGGTSAAMKVTAARPVEVPELVRYGVEVKVRVEDDANKAERVFVCGVQQGGTVSCPVAVEAI